MTAQDFSDKKRDDDMPHEEGVSDVNDTNEPATEETVTETEASSSSATSSSSAQQSTPTVKSEAQRRSGSGIVITLLWFAVLILAGVQFYLWQESKKDDTAWQTNTAQQLTQLESVSKQQQSLEERTINSQNLLQERLAAFETRINQMQTERQTMEKMYAQALPMRDEMVMREVENRVHFAEQQLAATGNIAAALSMLQEADHELATLNRADLSGVRSALIQDIETLQRSPVFDTRRFLARIDQSLEASATMTPYEIPTAMPSAPLPEIDDTVPNWQRWWNGIKSTMLSMVRVQVGEHTQTTPKTTDVALDRQELRMRLLALRMMILTRQPSARNEAISTSAWLSDHFDMNDAEVVALHSTLSDLVASPLAAPLPDLSKTLTALRGWRAEQARASGTY